MTLTASLPSARAGRSETMLSRYRALLADRQLGAYYAGQFVSWLGDWVNTVALLAVTYRLTGSTLGPVLVFVATQLPNIILPVVAGNIVDRWHRKHVLLFCDGVRVPLSALLVLAALLKSLPLLYLIVFLVTCLSVVYNLCKAAMLPSVVGRRQLLTANSLGFALFSLATVLGGLIGGGLVATIGAAAAFGFNSLTYLVSGGTILLLPIPPPLPLERPRGGPSATLRSLASGWHALHQDGFLVSITLLVLVVFFASGSLQVLFPLTADQATPWGRSGIGYLFTALGLGSVVGALLTADLGYRLGRARLFAAALVVAGISLAVFGLLRQPVGLLALVGIYGVSIVCAQSTAATAIQERAAPAFLGRIFALRQLLIGVATLLGSTLSGIAAQSAGRGATIVVVAVIVFVAGAGKLAFSRGASRPLTTTLEPVGND